MNGLTRICAFLSVRVDTLLDGVNRKHVHIELPGIVEDVFNKQHDSFLLGRSEKGEVA